MPPETRAILSGEGDWKPKPWFEAEAEAQIVARAAAELHRGIDLGVEAGAAADVGAALAKFLSLDVTAGAHARIALEAQVQLLLDLFDEMGVAVRLRADLDAGASASLAIGLNAPDFMALAREVMPTGSLGIDLLEIFLDEAVFEAGVSGQAAVAAMAYANISCTGNIVTVDGRDPGFYIVGDFGAGFEAGCGYRMFADVGIADPRRLVKRSVDAVVDQTLTQLRPLVDDAQDHLLDELRAPSKAAIRLAFEAGLALSRDPSGAIATGSDVARELALRCVQIVLEEAQRYLLEALQRQAIGMFREELGLSEQEWGALADDETHVVHLLVDERPDAPFAVSPPDVGRSNVEYWSSVVAGLDALADSSTKVTGGDFATPLALLWAGVELTRVLDYLAVDQAARQSSRYGQNVGTAFSGSIPVPTVTPPQSVLDRLADVLGTPATSLTQDQLFDFIAKAGADALAGVLEGDPAAQTVLAIVAGGETTGTSPSIIDVLRNAGSLYPPKEPNPTATLTTLREGLDWYLDRRAVPHLVPAVTKATTDEVLRLFASEVLLGSLSFTVDVVLEAILEHPKEPAPIREACSAVLLRLFSRTLVVTTDVLIAKAMGEISDHLELFAENTQPVSSELASQEIAQKLGWSEAKIDGKLSTALLLGAQVFQPPPDEVRRQIRELLYELLDTMPPPDRGAKWLTAIKDPRYVPDSDRLREMAGQVIGILERHLAEYLSARIEELVEKLQDAVHQVIERVESLANGIRSDVERALGELSARIEQLAGAVEALAKELQHLVNQQIEQALELIDFIGKPKNRSVIERELLAALEKEARKRVGKLGAKAIAPVLEAFAPKLTEVVSAGCRALRANDARPFLDLARSKRTTSQILDVLSDQLAAAIQRELTISVLRWEISLPIAAARSATRAALDLLSGTEALARQLLNLFERHDTKSDESAATTKRRAKAETAQNTANLFDTVFASDASMSITAPADGSVLAAAATISVVLRTTGVPADYLSVDVLGQARLMVSDNGQLATVTPSAAASAEQTIDVSFDLPVEPGLHLLQVAVVDSQGRSLNDSVGFVAAAEAIPTSEAVWGPSEQDVEAAAAAAQQEMEERSNAVETELGQIAAAGA